MIERIVEITNVGTFWEFRPEPAPALWKLTLIYGPNGTGKTTLCAILRSLALDDANILKGRKTLNREGASRVEIVHSGGERCVWDGERWTGPRPTIEIFDEQFVRENLYTDTVQVEQRRNLYRVIVGEEAVRLANEIAELTDQGVEKQKTITALESELKTIVKSVMSVDEFLSLSPDPEIDSKIREKEMEVAAHRSREKIAAAPRLERLSLPEPPRGLEELSGRGLAEVSADAEERVRQHLQRCGDRDGHRAWLERGLDYVEGEICPFCGQSLADVDLIGKYRALFSEAYRDLKRKIEAARDEVERGFGAVATANLDRAIAENGRRAAFWKSYVDAEWQELEPSSDWKDVWNRFHRAAREALERKFAAPLETVEGGAVREAAERLERMLGTLRKRNAAIDAINEKIEARKNAVSSDEIAPVESELERLRLIRKRREPETAKKCEDYQSLRKKKKEIEQEKEKKQECLKQESEETLQACQKKVNALLDRLGAGFRVHQIKSERARGETAAGWKIEIRQAAIDVAKKASESEPHFKNTLSAGDRSALAFAFFLAQLEQKADLAERIIVLDDPFTSLDWFRRNATINEIANIAKRAKQTIVVAHDSRMLDGVRVRYGKNAEVESFELRYGDQQGSSILNADLEFIARVTTRADLEELRAFRERGVGKPIDIVRKIRPVLEAAFRGAYPESVTPRMTLGKIVEISRQNNDLKKWSVELAELNDYTRQYHHGEDTRDGEWASIDSQELLKKVQICLAIVEELSKEKAF